MIQSTNCQRCGGELSDVAGTHLACEYCTTLHFVEDLQETIDRFIPLGSEVEARCPCCEDESLRVGRMEDHDVLYCRQCRGFLIGCEAMGSVVRDRRSQYGAAELEPIPMNSIELERNVRCPACYGPMHVHPYHGPGNVVIDSCPECHLIWLDHGEISRIERSPGRR